MLVVIGIMLILLSMALLGVAIARRSAAVSRIKADFQAISSALEQYHADFGNYPMATGDANGNYGAVPLHVLAKTLLSPEMATDNDPRKRDGKDGYGFAIALGGREYPAYLNPDKFKTRAVTMNGQYQLELLDHLDHPIAYYPRRAQPKGAPIPLVNYSPNVKDLNVAYYNGNDGPCDGGGADIRQGVTGALIWALGHHSNGAFPKAIYSLDANETQTYDGPYVLISAGNDGVFTQLQTPGVTNQQAMKDSDDVYNFDWK